MKPPPSRLLGQKPGKFQNLEPFWGGDLGNLFRSNGSDSPRVPGGYGAMLINLNKCQ